MLKASRIVLLFFFVCLAGWPAWCRAMPPGTLLYRTSSQGQMYGYSSDTLINVEKGIIKNIYSGHVGIYIGREGDEDYVVEALADGIVKTPLKYFVNLAEGEKFLGAKIPRSASQIQRAKAVAIAKSLAGRKLAYDFDFKKQKGPESGRWTCVGLAEKVYESADISNPGNLQALEYDPAYYAVDITPDGFDNYSIRNDNGDCFSEDYEFSKIARRRDLLIPAPELIGFDAGLEQAGERYIFIPYTQFLQPTLASVAVDQEISSAFSADVIRGKTPLVSLILRWSLINNPLSSLKQVAVKAKKAINNLSAKIFRPNDAQITLTDENIDKGDQVAADSPADNTPKVKVSQNTTKGSPAEDAPSDSLAKAASASKVNKKVSKEGLTDSDSDQAKAAPASAKPAASGAIKKSTSTLAAVKVPEVSNTANDKSKPVTKQKVATSTVPAAPAGNNPAIIITQSNSNNPAGTGNQTNSSTPPVTPLVNNEPKVAIFNKIYSTDNNDWIELFNPTDYDFDLAEASYRLEKAKTADDPSLMMRIGNAADGYYPGGTIIKAHDSYLIVRDDANDYYLDRADAVAVRDEFSWSGSGYTLYLGTGAISSSADPDIAAALGFGPNATYYQGSGPAPEILENYILRRINDNSDNATDFDLILSDDPNIVLEPPGGPPSDPGATTTPDGPNSTSTPATTTEAIASSSLNYLYIPPEPLDSPGINHLWHFDECYGAGLFTIGQWGCAREIGASANFITAPLTPTVDLGNFSLSFYFRNHDNASPKIDFRLYNTTLGASINVVLMPGLMKIYSGLPNATLSNYTSLFADYLWHQLTIVVDQASGHWAIYVDGEELVAANFTQTLPSGFDTLFIGGDSGLVLIDELAIWQRPLAAEEVLYNYQSNRPFNPPTVRPAQQLPELVHFWNFNEGHYLVNEPDNRQAFDSLSSTTLELWDNPWIWRQLGNSGLGVNWPNSLQVNLDEALSSKDLSLAFWWRNSSHPNEGRIKVGLKSNALESLSLVPNYYRPGFWFNSNSGRFSEGVNQTIPYDDVWHHLALVYDSYRYSLTFYVDGLAQASTSFVWIQDGNEPNSLEIAAENYGSEIDDLAIWEGALDPSTIQEIFANNQ